MNVSKEAVFLLSIATVCVVDPSQTRSVQPIVSIGGIH